MLENELEIEATREHIARAVRDAASGVSTLLACRGRLSVVDAVAFAQRHCLLGRLEDEVRVSSGRGRIHIQPRDAPRRRRIRGAPSGFDRRSVFDRRMGERRASTADDPAALAAVERHGERRCGEDRRSGTDRRRPSQIPRVPR